MTNSYIEMNDDIFSVIDSLKAEKPIILSTDTVIGIAALPTKKAAREIYRLKKRPYNMKLPWFISKKDIEIYACNIGEGAKALVDTFWPGALTIVLEASDMAKKTGLAAPDGSVAFRSPNDEFIIELLELIKQPLVCTSANLHRKDAVCDISKLHHAFHHLKKHISFSDKCASNDTLNHKASTIVDARCHPPLILRKGDISSYEIASALQL